MDFLIIWKMVLCTQSPEAFVFTQELEARVRLFAGMFWAGFLGLGMSLAGHFCLGLGIVRVDWRMPFLVLTALSLVLCFVFGWQVRRVRRQEADMLFAAYLALYAPKPV